MADVRPLQAIRYAPATELSLSICPPFDTISPDGQRRLYERSPLNAVRLELPRPDGDPYAAAARTLHDWLDGGALVRDDDHSFYVFDQQFSHGGRTYRRRILFGRLRVEPWERGAALPHERTFQAPKEDRLNLLRALRLNTSPVFLMYADAKREIEPLLNRASGGGDAIEFVGDDGLTQTLVRVSDPDLTAAITRSLAAETLYVADGHHRYETALAYRNETLGAAEGDGTRPEEFALVSLTAVDDPGLLVLPIHRLVRSGRPAADTLAALAPLFEVDPRASLADVVTAMASAGASANVFGLIAGEGGLYLLTLCDPVAAGRYLPTDQSETWRRLDASVADHVILRHALALSEGEMQDVNAVWYVEDAEAALAEVRDGRADYAVLLNPISPRDVIAIADAGERMPQKSTFFYPKVPTGLVFNPLFP